MAHKGTLYNRCNFVDWFEPLWPYPQPPKKFMLESVTMTGTLSAGWNGDLGESLECVRDEANARLVWTWENLPGTDPSTKLHIYMQVLTNAFAFFNRWNIQLEASGVLGNISNYTVTNPGGIPRITGIGAQFVQVVGPTILLYMHSGLARSQEWSDI